MTVCYGPPLSWIIGGAIVIYLATGVCLWRYLRAHHPSVWEWMGSPIFTQPTTRAVKSSIYTGLFAFSAKPEKLGDPKLNRIVWAFRVEFVLIMGIIVLVKAHGWLPPDTCRVYH